MIRGDYNTEPEQEHTSRITAPFLPKPIGYTRSTKRMNTQQLNRQQTEEKYKALKNNFFKRGILIGGMSGLLYGVYSAF